MVNIIFLFRPNKVLLDKLDADSTFDYKIVSYDELNTSNLPDEYAEVLVAAPYHRVDSRIIDMFPRLKYIIIHGSGTDKVDLDIATSKGIMVFNIPDYIAVTVAEHALALTLALTRKIVAGDRVVRDGSWIHGPPTKNLVGTVVRGKKVGIIGLGRIGSEAAKLFKAFGADVYYWSRRRKPEVEHSIDIEYKPLENLVSECDILIVSIALTPDTEKLINEELIGLMKRGSILINVSRGRVIDELALIKALEEGRIAGAGLDVFWEEPLPNDSPLIKMENVVLTPHTGGFSDYSSYYTALDVYRILREIYIEKRIPEANLVNKELIKKSM